MATRTGETPRKVDESTKREGTADRSRAMFLSQSTIRNHLSAVFRKLGVGNRTKAAMFAVSMGLAGPIGSPEAGGAGHDHSGAAMAPGPIAAGGYGTR